MPRTLRGPATPVPAAELARLRFPDGRPLPPSLRHWLAYDAAFAALFQEPTQPRFAPLGFRQLVLQEFGGVVSHESWSTFDKLLPGSCYLLPGGTDARRFLYVGEPDPIGEYPVLCVDTHDIPFVCVYSPGFDVWLAEMFRTIPGYTRHTYTDMFDHARYGAAMVEQARRNFGGYRALDENGTDTAHLDGNDWLESTGVGYRSSAIAAAASFGAAEDEETRPGLNPFTGTRPAPRRKF